MRARSLIMRGVVAFIPKLKCFSGIFSGNIVRVTDAHCASGLVGLQDVLKDTGSYVVRTLLLVHCTLWSMDERAAD